LQNGRVVCDCKNYFVCVIAKIAGYFMIAKKELNQFFIETILRV
jgi:hypothetical protein